MADTEDSSNNPTSVDNSVNQPLHHTSVPEEKYKDSVAGDHVVARPNNEPERSWTMAEIERAVTNDVFGGKAKKPDIYGQNWLRKSDFRLPGLTDKLEHRLRLDFADDIKRTDTSRVRDFDVRSQTMRMIAANAALGTYQFQKTQVFPYMRKNLALGYQKIDLLRKMVSGIGSLETAVVAKLEAIKMNTARAANPVQGSYLRKIIDAVKAKNIDRVAGNISDVITKEQDEKYKKYVTPRLQKLSAIFKDKSSEGGVNGVTKSLSQKLQGFHLNLKEKANNPESGFLGRTTARSASGVMGRLARFTENRQLSEGKNSFISGFLQPKIDLISTVQPFEKNGALTRSDVTDPTLAPIFRPPHEEDTASKDLLAAFKNWHKEYRQDQDILLGHTAAIKMTLEESHGLLKDRQTSPTPTSTTSPPARRSFRDRLRRKSAEETTAAPSPRQTTRRAKATPSDITPTPRVRTPAIKPFLTSVVRAGARAGAVGTKTLTTTIKAIPAVTKGIVTKTADVAKIAFSPVSKMRERMTTQADKPVKDNSPDRNFFGGVFGLLGDKLSSIDTSIKKDNEDRTKHERESDKRQSLAERLLNRNKPRKNSYEDLQAQKKAERDARRSRSGVPLVGAAVATGAATPSRGLLSILTGGASDSITDMIKERLTGTVSDAMDSAKDKAAEHLKEKAGGLKRKLKGRFSRKPKVSDVLHAVEDEAPSGKNGGVRMLRRFAGADKSVSSAIGRGAKGLLRGGGAATAALGRGGVGLLTSGVALSAGGAVAAQLGKNFIDEHATGGMKRAGDTAMTAVQYGAMGAQIGSMFGGVGAVPGALIGAGLGAIAANSDKIGDFISRAGSKMSASVSDMASKIGHINDTMWSSIVGKKAEMNYDGTVKTLQKDSLLQSLKHSFFGRKAQYAPNGQLIAPEERSLTGKIQYGFQKLLFGDKFDNGEYKEGTSIVAIMRDSISETLTKFGKDLKALPGQIKKGFFDTVDRVKETAEHLKNKAAAGISATGDWISRRGQDAKSLYTNTTDTLGNLQNFSWSNAKAGALQAFKDIGNGVANFSPTNFIIGLSQANFAWSTQSGATDDPTSPYYGFVTEVLNTYGIKTRSLYGFVHSLETSQDKINLNQITPFDDNDMAYMAGRFGFDNKNTDAVNYFKLWYKRRFLPGMQIINRILKGYKLTTGSALSADPKQIQLVTADIKKEVGATDLLRLGLEPSVQAYMKFAKIGSQDPGGVAPMGNVKPKPYDPRDPSNRTSNTSSDGGGNNLNAQSGGSTGNQYGQGDNQPVKAARRNAVLTKGNVKDQAEFKSAYQKLPPKIVKAVDQSKALQFLLYSTSIQHGADNASKIFQAEYTDQKDEKSLIRSIYQDRSGKFGNLSADDRMEATNHIGEEMRFTLGIQDGSNKADMGAMYREASNQVDPNGAIGSYSGKPLTGSKESRAKDAVNYLMTSKKYSKAGAVAMVASLIGESSLDYTNRTGDSGSAWGIAQWHRDRRDKISRHFNKPFESLDFHGQLDAVDWEVNGGDPRSGQTGLGQKLRTSQDVAASVRDVVYDFERPRDKPGDTAKRTKIAMDIQKTLGTSDVPPKSAMSAPAKTGNAPATPKPNMAANKAQTPALLKPNAQTPAANAPAPAAVDHSGIMRQALDDHSKHLQDNTKAMNDQTAHMRKGQKPVVVKAPTASEPTGMMGILSMSMKKMQIAAGQIL